MQSVPESPPENMLKDQLSLERRWLGYTSTTKNCVNLQKTGLSTKPRTLIFLKLMLQTMRPLSGKSKQDLPKFSSSMKDDPDERKKSAPE